MSRHVLWNHDLNVAICLKDCSSDLHLPTYLPFYCMWIIGALKAP